MYLIEKLSLSALKSSVLTNSFALLIVRGTAIGARLVVIFLIARTSTPTELGIIVYILSIVEIARYVADFGVDTFAVREFAIMQQNKHIDSFASLVLFTKLLCGVVIYAVIVVYFAFQGDSLKAEVAAVISLLLITSLCSNLTIDYFQAQLRMDNVLLPIVLTNVILVVIIGVMSWFAMDLILILATLPLAEALNAFILMRYLQVEVPISWKGWRWREVIKLLCRSLPLALTAIIVALYTRLDVVVLNNFLGLEAVGYYSIAFRITEPFQLIAGSFALSIYSHISATLVTNQSHVHRVVTQYLFMVALYGLVTCTFLVLVAPFFIETFLPEYLPAILILKILAVALIFRTVNTSLTSVIQAYGHFSTITLVAMFNLVLIFLLLVFLVQWLGIIGAVVALLSGEIINTFVQFVLTKKTLQTAYALENSLESV